MGWFSKKEIEVDPTISTKRSHQTYLLAHLEKQAPHLIGQETRFGFRAIKHNGGETLQQLKEVSASWSSANRGTWYGLQEGDKMQDTGAEGSDEQAQAIMEAVFKR